MSQIGISSRYSRSAFREFILDLREAISGSERDFTQIPLGKAILLLSIPMVLEMIMESALTFISMAIFRRGRWKLKMV